MSRGSAGAWMALLLGMALVINAIPRSTLIQRNSRGFRRVPLELELRDPAYQEGVRRREVLRHAGLGAAWIELLIGAGLVIGWATRRLLLAVGVLLVVFSVGLVVAAKAGWPVSTCGCFSFASEMQLKDHLLVNGALLGLCAAASWCLSGRRGDAQ